MEKDDNIRRAADLIRRSSCAIAFTGAGISLESGVPTFRGDKDSIWSKYSLSDIDIDNFMANPAQSWRTIKDCFYLFMRRNDIRPNKAHLALARLEADGYVEAVVTQNIDCLHQMAGSRRVIEFHGSIGTASCVKCGMKVKAEELNLEADVPTCPECGGLMKPDFVFFGEAIPSDAYAESFELARSKADLCIVVGTSGEVMPAAMIPQLVKSRGGSVIEVNPKPSGLTRLADVYIPMGAVDAFGLLESEIYGNSQKGGRRV